MNQLVGGVSAVLLGQIARDLMVAEFDRVIVAEVPTEDSGEFMVAIGATPSIRYQRMSKRL